MKRLTIQIGRRRPAPKSLRPTRLDPLHVDVLAAMIATLPPKQQETKS
ncbi:hypothetical protein [Hephaestia caeni]|nr:hypothetical protein [Hephaestia caeni]